jgi:hypothetical protein
MRGQLDGLFEKRKHDPSRHEARKLCINSHGVLGANTWNMEKLYYASKKLSDSLVVLVSLDPA